MSSLQSAPSITTIQPAVTYRLTHTWWMWFCMLGIATWNMWMVDVFPVSDLLFVWLSCNVLLWFCTGLALFAVMQAGYKYADQSTRLKVARKLMLTMTISCLLYWPVAYTTDPQQSQASSRQQAQPRPIPVLPVELPTTDPSPQPPIVETTVPTTTRQPTTIHATTRPTTTMPTTSTTPPQPREEEPEPISTTELLPPQPQLEPQPEPEPQPQPQPQPEPEPDPIVQPDPQVEQDPQPEPEPDPIVDEPVNDGVVTAPQ